VQSEILEKNKNRPLKVYAIWFNMVETDTRARWRGDLLTDPRVVQYWDEGKTIGQWYAARPPFAFYGDVLWDAYILYDRGERLTDWPTTGASWGRTILRTRDRLKEGVEKVWTASAQPVGAEPRRASQGRVAPLRARQAFDEGRRVAMLKFERHPGFVVTAIALGAACLGALVPVSLGAAVESPPKGISPSEFATKYSGCLGQLRSRIAQGDFAGIGPFGQHFTGLVNPGAHQGTVGEEEFLEIVIGIPESELAAFCAQFK
jgi:hypothetical protein